MHHAPCTMHHAPCTMHHPLPRTHARTSMRLTVTPPRQGSVSTSGFTVMRVSALNCAAAAARGYSKQRHGGTWSGAGAGAGARRVQEQEHAGLIAGQVQVPGAAGSGQSQAGPGAGDPPGCASRRPHSHTPHPTSSTRTCPWRTHQTLPCPPHTPTPASTHLDVGNVHREVNRLAPHLEHCCDPQRHVAAPERRRLHQRAGTGERVGGIRKQPWLRVSSAAASTYSTTAPKAPTTPAACTAPRSTHDAKSSAHSPQ